MLSIDLLLNTEYTVDDIPGGGSASTNGCVSYEKQQSITDAQKQTARANIGINDYESVVEGAELGKTALQSSSLKTINNESLVGTGNITIQTLAPMKDEWTSASLTTAEAAELMFQDGVKAGEGYVGVVFWSDLSSLRMGNAEVKAFVISDYIIQFEMTSGTTAPYAWFFNSFSGVWRSYVPLNDTLTSDSIYEALDAKQGKVLSDKIDTIPIVTGNPTGETTAKLNKIKIGSTSYSLQGTSSSVYADYSAMVTDINAKEAGKMELGWNIYVRTVDVPDLWISKNDESTSVAYTYTTDAQFLVDLEAASAAGLQIGYYRVNKLESEKVHIPVEDVTVDDTSVLEDGIAKISTAGLVKKVNDTAPDSSGNVEVSTFSKVPSTMDAYKSGTLETYCQMFTTLVAPKSGSAYLDSGITFSDLPKSFKDSGSTNCEIYIYIPFANYSGSTHNVCYIIEITTTNSYAKLWSDTPGKFMAIYQDETDHWKLHMPWQGMMGCPQSDELITKEGVSEHKFIPTADYHAASKYYVDETVATVVASSKTEIEAEVQENIQEVYETIEENEEVTAAAIQDVENEIVDNEEVASAAVNELKNSMSGFQESVDNLQEDFEELEDSVETTIQTLTQQLVIDEEVTAAAFNNISRETLGIPSDITLTCEMSDGTTKTLTIPGTLV